MQLITETNFNKDPKIVKFMHKLCLVVLKKNSIYIIVKPIQYSPKSAIFKTPSFVMRRFCGFRSL